MNRFNVADWGIPKVIISDRDRKFLSELWTAMFERLSVPLSYSTACHTQTDGSSERRNQIVEIALRFFVHGLKDASQWPSVLPKIQALSNNSRATSIGGKTPNEITLGFTFEGVL